MYIKSVRDVRIDEAHAYTQDQDETFKTPVEVLVARFAPVVEKLKSNKKVILQLIKQRGSKSVSKKIVLSEVVKKKLNKVLPKIKKFSEDNNGFLVSDLSKLLEVHRVAAHKYLNILLASNLIISDGKSWSARYKYNTELCNGCL